MFIIGVVLAHGVDGACNWDGGQASRYSIHEVHSSITLTPNHSSLPAVCTKRMRYMRKRCESDADQANQAESEQNDSSSETQSCRLLGKVTQTHERGEKIEWKTAFAVLGRKCGKIQC
jgi:hypothetical protein